MTRGIVLFIVAAAAVFLGLSLVIEPLEFCDAPGVIIVFGCTVILLYISFPLSDILQGVGFVFSGRKEIPAGKYLRLTRLYQAAGDYFLYCGVLGMLIGFVMMLQTMIDFSDLGPLLALSLITVLYGVGGKLFTLLLLHKLSLCATDGEQDGQKSHRTPAAFIVSLVLFSLVIVLGITQSGELVSFYEPAAVLIVAIGSLALA
ncbi:MAG: hypothetical protein JXQ83_11445, partial [Candidatus Glassbacteria bacterium]|nr:hypothetical protein [Candidatus Glassbacteria bacterium]